mgnify:CR=1 FL=1
MGLLNLFRRAGTRRETRASGGGFTAQVLEARADAIHGRHGVAEATAAAQGCVSLWDGGLSLADVSGTDALPAALLSLVARALALRGEFVALVGDDRLLPAQDWDVTTRDGVPVAYRLTLPDTAGGRSVTALAAEVMHVRIGSDVRAPWAGTPPLHRANLTAGLLQAVEAALSETYETAPFGSQVVPFPESDEVSRENLARSFRGRRGRVLLRESVTTTAAGGPTPQTDWKPSDLSPDLSRTLATETLRGARDSVCNAFGVLPAMLANNAAGPSVREGQRHLASWTLQPIAAVIAQEATEKLGSAVSVDALAPLQAYDAGGRARSFKGVIEAMGAARAAGLSDDQIAAAARFAGVGDGSG